MGHSRNEEIGTNCLYFKKYRKKAGGHMERPNRMSSGCPIITKNNRHRFSDDAMIKAKNLSGIYENLANIEKKQKYKIN